MSKFLARYTPECARLISKLSPETNGWFDRLTLLDKPKIGTELTGELDGYYPIE